MGKDEIWNGKTYNLFCSHCGRIKSEEGHDACLGELKGVKEACCGHDLTYNKPYITLSNGEIIRFENKQEFYNYINKIKNNH